MKEKMISKIILILIMSVMLVAIPMNTFATADGVTDLDEFLEGSYEEQKTETEEDKNKDEAQKPNPTPTPAPESTPKQEETLPKAGLAEDTMMVIAVIALGTIAIFANKKVKEYNNI